jgi:hypothetical protein
VVQTGERVDGVVVIVGLVVACECEDFGEDVVEPWCFAWDEDVTSVPSCCCWLGSSEFVGGCVGRFEVDALLLQELGDAFFLAADECEWVGCLRESVYPGVGFDLGSVRVGDVKLSPASLPARP